MKIPAYVLLLPLALFIIIFLVMRRKRLNYPPGSCGWPFLGETLEFLKANKEGKPEKFVKERIEKYKSKIFKTSLMGETVVVLGGATGNKFLFSNENKQAILWWPVTVKKLLGPCLANSVGEAAKIMKKMLSSFVSPDAFSRLYQSHGTCCPLPFYEILARFKVTCQLFMSIEDHNDVERFSVQFKIFLKGLYAIPLNLPGTTFYKAIRATNVIRKDDKCLCS